MKIFLSLLFLFIFKTSFALAAKGQAIEGSIALGGLLKNIIIPKALPLGTINNNYGYETWDISRVAHMYNNANRADYCTASIELELNPTLLGINFGADFTSIRTVGLCDDDPDSLAGEELTVSISYDAGVGSKSIPITASFRYSLAMQDFLDNLENYFNNPYQVSSRMPYERLRRMYLHVLKYLAKQTANKVITFQEKLLLKTFFFPAMFMKDPSDASSFFKFDLQEIAILKNLNNNTQSIASAFSNFPADHLDKIYKDPLFYRCAKGDNCDEIYLDFLNFKELLSKALVDGSYCHSVGISAGLKTDLSFKLSDDFNFGLSFGYSSSFIDKIYQSKLPLGLLVGKRYALHKFLSKSEECEDIEKRNANNFTRLLKLMGHGTN